MNTIDQSSSSVVSESNSKKTEKLEKWGFRTIVSAIFLAPIFFLPSSFSSLETAKVLMISILVAISVICYAFVFLKERKISLPPRSITWTSAAIVLSFIISGIISHPIGKSFWGQGFQVDTVGFFILLFSALMVVYIAIINKLSRAATFIVVSIVPFYILGIFHLLRAVFGAGFMSFGILTSSTSTLLGDWYSLGVYAVVSLIVVYSAMVFLPLSKIRRVIFWILAALSLITLFFINDVRSWSVAALVFLGLTVYITTQRYISSGKGNVFSWVNKITWVALIISIVFGIMIWKNQSIASPIIVHTNLSYSELRIPWQITVDIGAGALKQNPLFGVGPNNFDQAYISYHPISINSSDAWGAEFSSGSSLFSTLFVTQGFAGIITWLLLLILLGVIAVRTVRVGVSNSTEHFLIVSSLASSAFLWTMFFVFMPPHAILLLAFVMTGVFLGVTSHVGVIKRCGVDLTKSKSMIVTILVVLSVIIFAIIGIFYIKDAIAMKYFISGANSLSVSGDYASADSAFATALALDNNDLYWRGRIEATIAHVQSLAASVSATSTASSTQLVASEAHNLITQALGYADRAIAYNPASYTNYISQARVYALAAGLGVTGAYDDAVKAYTNAIKVNPLNPSLYVTLAQFQASQNKLSDALQTAGAALQVKSNYIDAVYLVSQIEAAQGNLKDAITASKVALQINPNSSLLYFQLGVLEYSDKSYSDAVTALQNAIKLQPDYANAKYYLGLTYARLGQTSDALKEFNELATTNQGNQTLDKIVTDLQAGKSIFASDVQSSTSTSSTKLPLKEKTQ